jgi:uncharacterized protein YqiB (DUF1249 family)
MNGKLCYPRPTTGGAIAETESQAVKKQRYQIDLAADMAECEANYQRLAVLLCDHEADSRAIGLAHGALHIDVVERCPYTTTLEVVQRSSSQQSGPHLPALSARMLVRVYHDARLAEVVGFASRRRVQPRYDYPNPAMHQPDEKSQWNRFLGEWLSHCLQHGFDLRAPQTAAL